MEKNLLVCLLHSNRHKQPPLLINAAILRRIPFLRRDYTYFSTQHKNRLPALVESGYISAAPHKTGAGITTPPTSKAHSRASGFFVRTVSPRLFRTRIMAGRTGPTSVGPDSLLAGCGNPVRLATLRLPPQVGEFSELTSKEATSWQTASNSAPALSVFTSAAKSTADFFAQHASLKSCTSICCMSAATHYQTFIPPLFSAIWRMICTNFNSSSSSKTNSINSCSGPFL
ncbi:ash family protein, partial [Escherichia coli]|nr:ash family protein [Escherichia coli]